MASTISVALGVDGAKEFQNAMAQSNAAIKTLGSELKLTTAQFAGAEKSEEAMRAKNDVLNRTILTLNEKLAEQEKALDAVGKQFGEGSAETLKYQDEVNKTKLAIQNAENAVKANSAALEQNNEKYRNGGELAKKFGAAASAGIKAAAAAAAAMAAAIGGAVLALGKMTLSSAQAADDILTLSVQTGLTTDQIQRFQYAAELIDVDLDTITKSMAKLTKSMATAQKGTGDAAKAFEALGVAITNEDGSLRDNQAVFDEAIAALGKIENETQRDAYAMQIFGKSAQELNPLIEAGAGALSEFGDEAEAAGLIMSEETLNDLNDVSDAVERFKSSWEGLKNTISAELAEPAAKAVQAGTDAINKIITTFKEEGIGGVLSLVTDLIMQLINKLITSMPQIIQTVSNILQNVINGLLAAAPQLIQAAVLLLDTLLNAIAATLPTLASQGGELLTTIIGGIIALLPVLIETGIQLISTLIEALAEAMPELIPMAVEAVITLVNGLIDNLDMLIDAGIQLIFGVIDGLINALPRLLEQAPVIIQNLMDALTRNDAKIMKATLDLIIQLAGGLIKSIPDLIKAVPKIIEALVNGLITAGSELIGVGKNLINGLWEGIKSMYDDLKNKIKDFFSGIVKNVKGFLGIASPSKVFKQIGAFCAEGMGIGFEDEMKDVERGMLRAIPTPSMVGSVFSAGANGAISNGGGDIVINLTSAIDGATLARNQYRYNKNEAARHGGSLVMG